MKIRQHTFAELDASLRLMSERYAAEPALHRECRAVVIEAKERARWASRNPKVSELKRRAKREMIEWMLVWLGDPALFPEWARLRLQHMEAELLSFEEPEAPPVN